MADPPEKEEEEEQPVDRLFILFFGGALDHSARGTHVAMRFPSRTYRGIDRGPGSGLVGADCRAGNATMKKKTKWRD